MSKFNKYIFVFFMFFWTKTVFWDDLKFILDQNPSFLIKYINFSPIIIFLLIYIFYKFIYKKYLKKLDIKKLNKVIIKENNNLNKELLDLKNNYLKYSKKDFYEKLDKIFREILKENWYNKFYNITLNEIKKLNKQSVFLDLFEEAYIKKFKKSENNKEERLNLLNNLIKIIKK